MNYSVRSPLLITCVALLSSCSRHGERSATQSDQPRAGGSSARAGMVMAAAPPAYPYTLSLGSSVYHVEQESESARLVIEFSNWTKGEEGGTDAVFRVTNRGSRPVLVWNVRHQIRIPGSNGLVGPWQTTHQDYPGRGWDRPMIPAGGSHEFPITPDTDAQWRVCLLYSRERLDSIPSNRLFDGTYESIGPTMGDADSPEDKPPRGANRE